MDTQNRWLLPEGIEEILPPHAARLDRLCRNIIDLHAGWGYQLVIPPLVEFLESLLTGTGSDLDLQTFKLTDQLSGRLLGIRADTTPQVARIDAHNLKRETPTRLCYLGSVLHTRPSDTGGTRSPLQVGAELYGHQGTESDAEILSLMLETLRVAGVPDVHVDIGHVGIYQALVKQANLDADLEARLFSALQRKAGAEINALAGDGMLPAGLCDLFSVLAGAYGDIAELADFEKPLAAAGAEVKRCLADLRRVAESVMKRLPDAPLQFDLAELRGYHYHTGIVFAAYVPGKGQGIAFGGRYDAIGRAFGRARPATGFSADIKTLLALSTGDGPEQPGIFAPSSEDPGLLNLVESLRQKGEIVICELPGQKGSARDMGCDRRLEKKDGKWQVIKVSDE